MSFTSYQEIKFLTRKLKDISPRILKILQICVFNWMTAEHFGIDYIIDAWDYWSTRMRRHNSQATAWTGRILRQQSTNKTRRHLMWQLWHWNDARVVVLFACVGRRVIDMITRCYDRREHFVEWLRQALKTTTVSSLPVGWLRYDC